MKFGRLSLIIILICLLLAIEIFNENKKHYDINNNKIKNVIFETVEGKQKNKQYPIWDGVTVKKYYGKNKSYNWFFERFI